jgi:ABC-2 type transport system permease protein
LPSFEEVRHDGHPIGNNGVLAVAWCVAISVVGYLWARRLYDRNPAS